MVSERLINRFEESLTELAEIGGTKERTGIVPNLEVIDAAPGITGFIIVEDSKDGDYITAATVPGMVYANGNLVNVLFIEGAEPIAYQHGTGSSGVAFAVDRVYRPDFTATVLTGDNSNDVTLTAGDLIIPDDIVHSGDADTLRSFTTDAIADQAGGIIMLRMTETTQDLVEIGDVGGAGDVDINFNSGQVFIRGSDGEMGVGTNDPRTLLHALIGGTPGTPAPIGRHAIFLQNTTIANSFASMAIVAGNTGQSSVDFGDTDDVDVGRIVYRHADEEFRINVGAVNVLFITDPGNFGFNHSDYGGGEGVLGIEDAATNPSSDPTGGGILYSDAGAGKWRGSGGTTTTFGPAEPHCPICGRDTALEWENEIEGWYLHICATCLADELGDRLWIQRKRING